MTYKTLLVHVEAKGASNRRVTAAAALAREFEAALIGVGAAMWDPFVDPSFSFISGEVMQVIREDLEAGLKEAEASFRDITKAAGVEHVWRSAVADPAYAVCAERRGADLIIAARQERQALNAFADPADLVMGAGLPVLVLPPGLDEVTVETVLVCWKNTREAARALSDSLPFIRRARRVVVASVAEAGADTDSQASELEDVLERLRRHGVAAEADLSPRLDLAAAEQLLGIIDSQEADLVVAGAYGHSRMREWVLGGVTERLLEACPCPLLLSR